jgi:hypothetical protein
MSKILQVYLNELFGFGDPSNKIIGEINRGMEDSAGINDYCDEMGYEEDDPEHKICVYTLEIKSLNRAINQCKTRIKECKNNKKCINKINTFMLQLQKWVKEYKENIKQNQLLLKRR